MPNTPANGSDTRAVSLDSGVLDFDSSLTKATSDVFTGDAFNKPEHKQSSNELRSSMSPQQFKAMVMQVREMSLQS